MNFNEMNQQFENSALYRESRRIEEAEDEEELLREAEDAALDEPIDLGEGGAMSRSIKIRDTPDGYAITMDDGDPRVMERRLTTGDAATVIQTFLTWIKEEKTHGSGIGCCAG